MYLCKELYTGEYKMHLLSRSMDWLGRGLCSVWIYLYLNGNALIPFPSIISSNKSKTAHIVISLTFVPFLCWHANSNCIQFTGVCRLGDYSTRATSYSSAITLTNCRLRPSCYADELRRHLRVPTNNAINCVFDCLAHSLVACLYKNRICNESEMQHSCGRPSILIQISISLNSLECFKKSTQDET